MRTTRTMRSVLAGLAVLATVGTASAQTSDPASPPAWMDGLRWEGYGEAGVRFLPDRPTQKESAKFLEYRDINQGLYLEGLWLRLYTPDEKYSALISGRQWGLEDQEYHFSFERLGRWETGFDWDQMRHVFSTTARIMWNETSDGVFALANPRPRIPGNPGIGYNNGASLDEISVRWDTAHLYFKVSATENLDLFAEYSHTHKHGERPFGMPFGSPGGNAFEILQPIDQTIHDFRLRASWVTEKWQLQAAYTMSIFVNDFTFVRADNPCQPAVAPFPPCAGGDVGTTKQFGDVSLPPGNMAHTFTLQGGVNLPLRTRLSGNFSYSLRLQNEDFMPQTNTNSRPATTPSLALPQDSLNGNVQTFLLNLNATSRPLPIPVTFSAKYRLYELYDSSDVVKFSDFIINDQNAIARGPHWSQRFSYLRQNGDVDARWQVAQPVALTLGAGWERWDRSKTREVPTTDEAYVKAAVDATPTDWLLIRASYTPSLRRMSEYNTSALSQVEENAAPGEPGQSYLLRKFDEADRNRHRADLMLQITPIDTLTLTPTASYKNDDYVATGLTHDVRTHGPAQGTNMLGLQSAISWSAGMDINWAPSDRLSFSAGYMHESIFQKMRSRTRNPDNPDLDWISDNTDTIETLYASVKAALIPRTLDFKFGAAYQYALGRVENWNPNALNSTVFNNTLNAQARPWPAFEDSLLRIEASLRYHFAKVWTAGFHYTYEMFRKHDWRTDTIQPFVPNDSAVYLGNDLRNYNAHIVGVTIGYRFE